MIRVTKPIQCPQCGYMMTTFKVNMNSNTLVFSCENMKHSVSITESEYVEYLRTGEIPKHDK